MTRPFLVDVPDEVLDDLRARLRATRWPSPAPGAAWEQGTDLSYLRELVAFWADGFDWRAAERRLNSYPQFVEVVDGVPIHFVHQRAAGGGGLPLVLTHGWPSAWVELLPLVSRLTDPAAHGIDGPAFDVVAPSLPGYGFTARPAHTGVTTRYVAGLWHGLMAALGYPRYGAQGGDFGAGVATWMALTATERVTGVHLTTPEVWPYLGPGSAPLTPTEQAYVDHLAAWDSTERGYTAIQSTRPQTLGYGLTDSPAGLAAWIVEKWRAWGDTGGDVDGRLGRDFLLTLLTVYWATGSITTSIRDYYDNRWHGSAPGPADRVTVPTATAVFANEFVPEGVPPPSWAERLYDVRRRTVFPRGGHFAAVEEPDLVARDIAEFFGTVLREGGAD
ncbi:hydrolase [Asanoa ishikariensis]|uniref:Pimeloyl-ACP methyl ester carboxylesterase n=1 Tax=Asanoa ishikariensis TaxID=137265 RepID=A0A1H3PBJ5_9ACTN|nr:epoxide hydrolase family protein [Asanoa ishikariensis]GIF68003.1 hydrolase [Asanoa ishikariensis]SDY97759.1 Pimeloyl-ACP methyl ester carboxylesterase [Asanoa ishikariensis]